MELTADCCPLLTACCLLMIPRSDPGLETPPFSSLNKEKGFQVVSLRHLHGHTSDSSIRPARPPIRLLGRLSARPTARPTACPTARLLASPPAQGAAYFPLLGLPKWG